MYTQEGDYTITVDVWDDDYFAIVDSWAEISEAGPTISGADALTLLEYQTPTLSGTWSDYDETVSLSVDRGTLTQSGDGTAGTWFWTGPGGEDYENSSYAVDITATNSDGATFLTSFMVTIEDPAVDATGSYTYSDLTEGISTGPLLLATFTDPGDPYHDDPDPSYSATVDWGDSSTETTATISYNYGLDEYQVWDSHLYKDDSYDDSYPFDQTSLAIAVTIFHDEATPQTVYDYAEVGEAPLTASGAIDGQLVYEQENVPFSEVAVANVTVYDPTITESELTASIDWALDPATLIL